MLILAFDTATEVATSALVDDGEVLAERASRAQTVLEDVDALLRQGGAHPRDLGALAVGTGPGSFTGMRVGLAAARVSAARSPRTTPGAISPVRVFMPRSRATSAPWS